MGCNSLSQNDYNINLKFFKKNNQMKKTSLLILGLILSAITFAQAPNKMSFQTVVRNSQGKLVLNKSIGVRISILQSTSTGTEVYVETHTKSSNANGLFTLEVGSGSVATGTFSTIDWSQGPYFLKTEMDENGGTNYTISGVTEFVSVPYALNSKNADNANSVKTVANGANVGDMNYWNGTTWVPLNAGSEGQTLTFCGGKPTWTIGGVCPGTKTALNCSLATNNGTLTATTAASGVTSVISYTGGNGGTHNGQVVTCEGVTGLTATLQAGTFANGNGSLMYTITGTPSTGGTAIFALNTGGKSCVINRSVVLPVGVLGTLDCVNATNNGTLTATSAASNVTSVISYTGGNGGTHNGQIVTSTGVSGLTATLQAGTSANGNGSLTYTITGTPASSGTASFALNIGGKTCTLTRNVLLLVGVISTLECSSATNNGTLTATTAASGVTSIISYTGGNGGTHNGQVVTSSGVTGLTATLQAGTFANGNGSLTYTITGTPSTGGTAIFALNTGGKSCVINRSVVLPLGVLGTLDCVNATNNGTLTATSAASNVTSVISYTGGNGGTHNGQVVTSSGVTGLTATLQAGTSANGNGSLTYTITGTPSTSGTASFALNIGGKTCTLTRNVLLLVGVISTLECLSATNNGTLTATTAASGVTSVISYTGGNGGTHNGQVVTFTGVTGLTATLQAGTFANGNGNLTYTITGTPATSGTASFALNIGGKTCTVTRTVAIAPQNPTSSYGSNITDVEGNSYKTVFIGTQQWMGENLKTSRYSDGTTIPTITDNTQWSNATQWSNLTTGAWAYHNNAVANNEKYGKLYNWYAVNPTSNGNKNVCPTGWHVPTNAEWTVLTDYLGGASVAGGKMKEVGTTNWNSENTDATNTSLFTGLPGGIRYFDGYYYNITSNGYWWSSTEANTTDAWYRGLYNSNGNADSKSFSKNFGLSVRCLRD